MSDEICVLTEGVPTLTALTRILSGACYVVTCRQLRLLTESLPTHGAYMWFLPPVHSPVLVQARALTTDIHSIACPDGLNPAFPW